MSEFELLLQNSVSGLMVGALYGLAALGLSLVFGVLKILNVAHGELIMLGGYASFWVFNLYGIDPFVSLVIVLPALFLLGLLAHQGLFRLIVQDEEEHRIKNSLLIGFGLTLILHNLAILFWTADDRAITTNYSLVSLEFLGIRFPVVRLAGLLLSVLIVVLMEWFLEKSFWGKAIRATAENWETASLTGINVERTYLLTFALGAMLAGVGGMLISVGYSVNPAIGLEWTLKALIVVVLAGLGSMRGTLIAGLLLGVAESASAYFVGSEYREMIGIILFLAVLSFRPQGLFGRTYAKH
jgi:branched-chain amino acid transport system permease protein